MLAPSGQIAAYYLLAEELGVPAGGSVVDTVHARIAELEAAKTPRPINEWHEDMGTVLWWHLPVEEPPYVGTPLDDDWTGYHTHWTPILIPNHDRSR